ncbi:MAG: molecular chaperone DnaJ [Gemmatimonadales bacterium]|nr:molecular chaperone DnaJ [Gemmatimonadales bacterium]
MSDFYQLLGVAKDASDDELKKAYRKAAMQYHPDRNKEPGAEEKFKEIAEAYDVLRDPQKRAAYDRYGKAGVGGAAGGGGAGAYGFHHMDLNEALRVFMDQFGVGLGGFESVFGEAAGGGRGGAERGPDVKVRVELTLDEVTAGVKRTLKLRTLATCEGCAGTGARKGSRPERCSTCAGQGQVRRAARSVFGQFVSVSPCPACGGTGEIVKNPCADCKGDGRVKAERKVTVDIPPGVSSNNYLTLRGQGAAGPRGGPPGDLIVVIDVQADERFERAGDDLVHQLPVSFSQAALGAEMTVPSPHGEQKLDLPPGTQSGTVFRLRGRGLPRLGGNGYGDLLIRAHVWTPEKLSSEQRRLLEELAGHEQDGPAKESGFWARLKEALGA